MSVKKTLSNIVQHRPTLSNIVKHRQTSSGYGEDVGRIIWQYYRFLPLTINNFTSPFSIRRLCFSLQVKESSSCDKSILERSWAVLRIELRSAIRRKRVKASNMIRQWQSCGTEDKKWNGRRARTILPNWQRNVLVEASCRLRVQGNCRGELGSTWCIATCSRKMANQLRRST
jgi:hypothetical protein